MQKIIYIMPHYDYLIVGSGLYGTTFAYKAKQAGKKVLVIEKRPHLGGNVYCESIEGISMVRISSTPTTRRCGTS